MQYEYIGYNRDRRVVKGTVTAVDAREAGDNLTRGGYQVLSIKPVSTFFGDTPSLFRESARTEEIVMFSRQLALLLESGVGIIQSLELLQAQTANKGFARMIGKIVEDLRAGTQFSNSLQKHPGAFSKMYCRIVAVGEQMGQLEPVLRNLADYAEKASAAAKKIRQSITYPIIVFLLAIVVGIIAITFVLPPVMNLFKTMGGTLPLITVIFIWIVNFFSKNILYIVIAAAVLALATYLYVKTPVGAYQKDLLLLRMPPIGRLNLLNGEARVCRSMSMLFKSGLPLPEILTLTAESSGNRVLARALMKVEEDIIKGDALAASMVRNPLFMPLMVEMTRVGEETGNLDNTLTLVADSFEIEAEDKLQTLLTMVEPAMTIGIGIVVGFLALSIFVPIYSSLSLIGG